MRVSAKLDGLQGALSGELARYQRAVTDGMRDATSGLKEEMRDQTFRSLGMRVAYAWRGETYPKSGASLEPAAYVYTNAPRIIDFFSATRMHTPLGGAFAIPTGNVPRKRGGLRMSPLEVEGYFNAELQARRLKSGNIGLFMDVIRSLNVRRPGFRRVTRGRLSQGRSAEPILMFTLVRTLMSRKLIDLDGPAQRWAARVPALVEARMT